MASENQPNTPVHVSLIMDGNGRWAKERGQERVYGHLEGVESVRACVEAAVEAGVRYLSLYAFSEENWNRPEAEVTALMGLMVKAMANEMDSLHKNGVRFVVIGNRERLAPELNETIDSCMAMTAGNQVLTLVIFLSYSGKWDILQAAKKMALEMFEHPEKKEDILELVSDTDSDGVNVVIGSESSVKVMNNSALVFKPVVRDGKTIGAIGIIGPRRMDYAKVVATIEGLAGNVESILNESTLMLSGKEFDGGDENGAG